jgi:hypothetical protein
MIDAAYQSYFSLVAKERLRSSRITYCAGIRTLVYDQTAAYLRGKYSRKS